MSIKKWNIGQIRNGYPVLPKQTRKTVLFIGDLLIRPSGVGMQTKQIIQGTCHYYNYINLGYTEGIDVNKISGLIDQSEHLQKITGVPQATLNIIQYSFYHKPNLNLLLQVIDQVNPKLIIHFTDPRSWYWMYQGQRIIRNRGIPLVYYHVWDNIPYPRYNEKYYACSDNIMCISKLSYNIVKSVSEYFERQDWQTSYVPHGINEQLFFPLGKKNKEFNLFKQNIKASQFKFSILHNNKNMDRKNQATLMQAWRDFLYLLPIQQRKECRLLIKSDPYFASGVPLTEVYQNLIKDYSINISIINKQMNQRELNMLYNSVDLVISNSDAQGYGLATAEGLMAGVPMMATVIGGLQDQMRFEDEQGRWIDFTGDFPTNSYGRYVKHGNWAYPLWIKSTKISGSRPTPYIYYMYTTKLQIIESLLKVYNTSKEQLKKFGLQGRQWMCGDQSNMSSKKLCQSFIKNLKSTLKHFKPRLKYDFLSFKEIKPLKHAGVYNEYKKEWY